MRIRLSSRSYEDAVGIATLNGKRKYHKAMAHIANDFACDKLIFVIAEHDDSVVGMAAGFVMFDHFMSMPKLIVKKGLEESNVRESLFAFLMNHAKNRGIMRAYIVCGDSEHDDFIRGIAEEQGFKTLDIRRCEKHGTMYMLSKDMVDEKTIFNRLVAVAKEGPFLFAPSFDHGQAINRGPGDDDDEDYGDDDGDLDFGGLD